MWVLCMVDCTGNPLTMMVAQKEKCPQAFASIRHRFLRITSWCQNANCCATILLSVPLSFMLCYMSLSYCVAFYHSVYGNHRNTVFKPREDFVRIYPKAISSPVSAPGATVASNKIILLWTTFFKRDNWVSPNRVYADKSQGLSCTFTSNKSVLAKADAVLFHPQDFEHQVFPGRRYPHQRYVLFSMEPPYYNLIFAMSQYNNLFNWTMTVRRDADIKIHYSGKLEKLPTRSVKERTEILEEIKTNRERKAKLAVARISNCLSLHSPRLHTVSELKRLIPVDLFGFCGEECPPDCDGWMKNYKFYLSFENGLCRDYLTEKTFSPLMRFNSVPVVLGGSQSDDLMTALPPHSYISVADFNSTEALAEYLKLVDQNDTLYEEYFHWKLNYTFLSVAHFEKLCQDLFDPSKPAQVYSDLEGWFLEDTCHYNELNAVLQLWPFLVFFLFTSMVLIHLLSRRVSRRKVLALVLVVVVLCVLNILKSVVFRKFF